ncbi:NAC domain-containing protein 8 [Sesbania bispinosa]|nr:NAC domain-containing protein 8 [Sesbania bispinosa]
MSNGDEHLRHQAISVWHETISQEIKHDDDGDGVAYAKVLCLFTVFCGGSRFSRRNLTVEKHTGETNDEGDDS